MKFTDEIFLASIKNSVMIAKNINNIGKDLIFLAFIAIFATMLEQQTVEQISSTHYRRVSFLKIMLEKLIKHTSCFTVIQHIYAKHTL